MPISELYVESLKNAPVPVASVDPTMTYTLPDMHGNAMYLLYTCGLLGVFKFTQASWDKLWAIYDKVSPVGGDFDEFNTLVVQSLAADSHFNLRLIGDILADRGKHDYLTLIVLEVLHGVLSQLTIIYSNHDAKFLASSRAHDGSGYFRLDQEDMHEQEEGPSLAYFFNSMLRMSASIENGHVSYERVMHVVEQVIFPSLKLVDYEVVDGELVFFTHAPSHPYMINNLGMTFHAELFDCLDGDVTKTKIDELNGLFLAYVRGETHDDFVDDVLQDFIEDRGDLAQGYMSFQAMPYLNVHGHVGEDDPMSEKHLVVDGELGRPGYDTGLLSLFASCPLVCSALTHVDTLASGDEVAAAAAVHQYPVGSHLALWMDAGLNGHASATIPTGESHGHAEMSDVIPSGSRLAIWTSCEASATSESRLPQDEVTLPGHSETSLFKIL